ncbi:MAG: DUF192 domain-containing protein [Candidatus Pacebacteria bacterium]|nr:DUF192 domain-containing protein [Candidatus Paceibacterota bacterium]
MKKLLLFVVLLLITTAVFIFFTSEKYNLVCFGSNCFQVEIADNSLERSQGLMFRQKLDSDKGMLFIFENEGEYPFWMKNTLIPLDIIWINGDKEVVFISENAQPCMEEFSCPSINPGKNARYVLEINGGISEKIGLNIGNKANFLVE